MDKMDLYRLNENAIMVGATAPHKKALLQLAAGHLAHSYGLNAEKIYQGFMARENIGSTGFGRNIAYPHCRMAAIDKPVVAILTLQDSVDYAAFDKREVDCVFAMVSPELSDGQHLQALAALSRLGRNERIMTTIRGTNNAEAIFALLQEDQKRDAA